MSIKINVPSALHASGIVQRHKPNIPEEGEKTNRLTIGIGGPESDAVKEKG